MIRRLICVTAVVAGLAAVPAPTEALPLAGTFSLSGAGADVRVGPNFIDWGLTGNVFGTPLGDIQFDSATGDFAGIALTLGQLEDLNSASHPVGPNFVEDNFLRVLAQPGWNFQLNHIFPGAGTAAGCNNVAGSVCTPFPTSPFTITNTTSSSSSVAMTLNGTLINAAGGVSNWTGTFTTQFTTLSSAGILSLLASQGYVQSAHSAEFSATVTPVPEPALLSLMTLGPAALLVLRRRRTKK
jgi:hypothetical protein